MYEIGFLVTQVRSVSFVATGSFSKLKFIELNISAHL